MLFAVALVLQLAPAHPQDVGANLLENGRNLVYEGELKAADNLVRQIKNPGAELLDLRGVIALEQGNFEEAEKLFRAANEANPALFLPRLHRGDALLRQKKFTEARDVYQAILRETNILISNERLRYGILVTHLAEKNDSGARKALDGLKFPTETPAYYLGHAAWDLAHNDRRSAKNWMKTARQIFPERAISWFERPLFDLGWLKKQPKPVPD